MERARSFFGVMQQSPRRGARRGEHIDVQHLQLLLSSEVVAKDSLCVDRAGRMQEAFYVVQPAQGQDGYVIMAADERQHAVLGYSRTGHFDPKALSDNELGWLTHYATEMRGMRRAAAANPADNAVQMLNLLPIRPEGVEPLTTVKWSQNAPFYNMCPNPQNRDEPCVTGCVATAMAQVMKHYHSATPGKGSHSYTSKELQLSLSADYEGVTYDWDLMPNMYEKGKYTQAQADAVAQLMMHCGVAVNMDYNYGGSSASSSAIASALRDYYGYDRDILSLMTQTGVDVEWHRRALHELNESRLLVYATMGHCFLLDGYEVQQGTDAPYYHMNMGWGGRSDTYYLLSAITALDVSSETHQMIIGVQPEDNQMRIPFSLSAYGFPKLVQKGVTPAFDGQITLSAQLYGGYKDYTTMKGQLELVAYRQDGLQTTVGRWPVENLRGSTFKAEANIDLAAKLSIGYYALEWRYYADGDDAVHYTLASTISANSVIVYQQSPQLTAQMVDKDPVIEGEDHQITFVVTNRGQETYYGALTERIQNEMGAKCEFTSDFMILPPGQSVEWTFSGTILDLPGGPATYSLLDSYLQDPVSDEQGGALVFVTETQPLLPRLQYWSILLTDRSYSSPYSYSKEHVSLTGKNEKNFRFDGSMALAVVDDYDNVLELLWKIGDYSVPEGYGVYYGSMFDDAAVQDLVYKGNLPDGEYKVKVAVQQMNAGHWHIFTSSKVHPGACVPLTLSSTTGVVGNDASGTIQLKREAWSGQVCYHNLLVKRQGVGQLIHDSEPLFAAENHRVCSHEGDFGLRIIVPQGHRVTVLCDGEDVTAQIRDEFLHLNYVTTDHELEVRFEEVRGDVNGDAVLSVSDLTTTVELVRGHEPETYCFAGADANSDGKLDQLDVEATAEAIVTNGAAQRPEHAYVDLGLEGFPNLRWATCNLGAEHPFEVGDFYSWGETAKKLGYAEAQYKLYEDGDKTKVSKYNDTDHLTRLQPEDDAAHVQWGDNWRMPRVEETRALAEQCTVKYYYASESPYCGVAGTEVKGPNGNTIFLPSHSFPDVSFWFTRQGMWTSDLKDEGYAYFSIVYSLNELKIYGDTSTTRDVGATIRPVCEVK